MKKPFVIVGIIVVGIALVAIPIVRGIYRIIGYSTPVDRFLIKKKTEAALKERYPEHDFDVWTELPLGEYGYSLRLLATDEEGVEFWMHWIDDELEDHYHGEWNKAHYGKAVVAYQDKLRDRYFTEMPYVASYEYYPYDSYVFFGKSDEERFFESPEDAIEGSKDCCFDTSVTFTGIDIDTVDGEELQQFAESLADSMIRIQEEIRTGPLPV